MKIGIVGAGMIGSHVAKEVLAGGHTVAMLDASPDRGYIAEVVCQPVDVSEGNAADFASVMAFIAENGVQAVVHNAGLIGGAAQRAPWKALGANIGSTANVAEASRIAGVEQIVYISTQGVYDVDRCRSEAMTESSPVSAARVYAAAKLSAEHILEAYGRGFGIDVALLRVANVYGRGHYVAGSSGGRAFNALVEPVASGNPGVLLPGAKGLGEWVYVKDVARAVSLALARPHGSGLMVANIGTGVLTTHEDVMAAVRRCVPDATFEEDGTSGTDVLRQRHQPYDLRVAKVALGYVPEWDLASGVRDYLDEVRGALARR